MPDSLMPEKTETTETTATAAEESVQTEESATETTAESEDVYDTAFEDTRPDLDEPPEPVEATETETETEETVETEDTTTTEPQARLTESEVQILSRVGIDKDMTEHWSREQIDAFVDKAETQRAEMDKLGAERGREQQTDQNKKAEPKEASGFDQEVDKVMDKMAESYDDDIKPLGDLIKAIGRQSSQPQVSPGADFTNQLVAELALDAGFRSIEADYPSITKPDVREAVEARFWKEWNTGEYAKPGVPISRAMPQAVSEAAKVVISNTTETAAAANLVTKNKARVQAQPKRGPSTTRKPPVTEDDMYDRAFQDTMVSDMEQERMLARQASS